MTILRLHDRARTLPDWTACLSETQFAVFLSDIETRGQLDLTGQPIANNAAAVCYVFDTLAEAEVFGREKVDEHPQIFCEIYDHRGKAVDPIRAFTHPSRAHHLPNRRSARRKLIAAWLVLAVSAPLYWIDWRHEFLLVFPSVVGSACVVTWIRLLYWGYSELDLVHKREESE